MSRSYVKYVAGATNLHQRQKRWYGLQRTCGAEPLPSNEKRTPPWVSFFHWSGLRVSEQKRLSIVFVTRSQQSKESAEPETCEGDRRRLCDLTDLEPENLTRGSWRVKMPLIAPKEEKEHFSCSLATCIPFILLLSGCTLFVAELRKVCRWRDKLAPTPKALVRAPTHLRCRAPPVQ